MKNDDHLFNKELQVNLIRTSRTGRSTRKK